MSRHDRSCQCLPVTTYDGRGYTKRNINLEEHGLIYSGAAQPQLVPGVRKLPLKFKEATEDVDVLYINYGRAYCVETNVKVKDVGMIDGASRKLLRRYYREAQFPDDEYSADQRSLSFGSRKLDLDLASIGGDFPS